MKPKQQDPIINIWLADDDEDDRYLFEQALKKIPVATHFTYVQGGEELMDNLYKKREDLPHVLFLDLIMPRKSGLECLTDIKKSKDLKDIPVVMLSTSFSRGVDFEKELKDLFYSTGALEYIRKPGNFEQLKQLIHNVLLDVLKKEVA